MRERRSAPSHGSEPLDQQDAQTFASCEAARRVLDQLTHRPRPGDVAIFPGGGRKRIASVLRGTSNQECWTVYTSDMDEGSFHLFKSGDMAFSGSSSAPLPAEAFVLDGLEAASAWIFHHGKPSVGRRVVGVVTVRRWRFNPD